MLTRSSQASTHEHRQERDQAPGDLAIGGVNVGRTWRERGRYPLVEGYG